MKKTTQLASSPKLLLWFCLCFVLAFSLAASPLRVSAAPDAPTIRVEKTVAGEGADYATQVLGLPWDMKSGPYPDFTSVFPSNIPNFDRGSFSMGDGKWNVRSISGDPGVWILNPGIVDTQQVLRIGDKFPIDANRFFLLSVRMCSSVADNAQVIWYHDQMGVPGQRIGVTKFFTVYAGCNTYVIDLKQIAKLQGNWTGIVRGLRFEPGNQSGTQFVFDWIRLTGEDFSNVVPIRWENLGSASSLGIYVNKTCSANEASLIAEISQPGSSGVFNWGSSLQHDPKTLQWLPMPESLEPGEYVVFALVNRQGSPSCAGQTVTIDAAPTLTFQVPSFESGPDYASEVVQDAWGMVNAQDVKNVSNLSGQRMEEGIFKGVSHPPDPFFFLNVSSPINTSKYHYVTFRYKLDSIGSWAVSVQRLIWWYSKPEADAVTTEDMLVYEGWHTYAFDLRTAPIDAISSGPKAWTGAPKVFRFDVHEESSAIPFELDYLKLTGDHTVSRGAPFTVIYKATPGATVKFFFDTDRNAGNGQTEMEAYDPADAMLSLNGDAASGRFRQFFPAAIRPDFGSAEFAPYDGTRWTWNTSNVSAGTYYVGAQVSDGVNTTTWYSDVPVIVQ